MNPLELLPTTQQAALRAAAAGRLTFRNSSAGYVATSDGSQHPVRTVRALSRAGLVELADSGADLTTAGRDLVEGRA